MSEREWQPIDTAIKIADVFIVPSFVFPMAAFGGAMLLVGGIFVIWWLDFNEWGGLMVMLGSGLFLWWFIFRVILNL